MADGEGLPAAASTPLVRPQARGCPRDWGDDPEGGAAADSHRRCVYRLSGE